jgi:hypothetical protein
MEMKSLLEAMNKFAGEPEQKAGDQVRGADVAKKSGKGKKHPFLNQLVGEMKATETERNLKKEFAMFKEGILDETNPADAIKLNIPLLIRLLEYAREDAKTDMDLHNVAEQLISLGVEGTTLTMDNYDAIVSTKTDEAIDPPSSQGTTGQEPAGNNVKPVDRTKQSPEQAAQQQQDQQTLTKNINQLKAAGINLNPSQAVGAFTKADNNVALNPTDKENISKLAPAIGDIMANGQLAGQFKALVQKAQQQSAVQQNQQATK